MRTLVTVLLLSFGMFSTVQPALAGEGRFPEIVAQLGLSAEQQAKVEEIIYQSKTARVDVRARLDKAKLELRHALGAETLDEKAVRKATDNLNAATAGLVQNRVDQVIALRKVLTAAQFEQLEGMWKGGHGEGGGRGERGERLRDHPRGGDGPVGG